MTKTALLLTLCLVSSTSNLCWPQDAARTRQLFEKLDKKRLLPPKSFTNVSDALTSILRDAEIDEVNIPDELSVASWENCGIADSKFGIPFSTSTCIKAVLLETDFTFVVADSNVLVIRNDKKSAIEYAEIHDIAATNVRPKEFWSAFVQSVIAPDCWKANGGESEIVMFDDFAIVESTETVHEQIVALNHFLRCYADRSQRDGETKR